MKTVIAKSSFVNTSPRKLQLVANAIRKVAPQQAVIYLQNLPHRAATPLLKVYKQAIGNAKNNFSVSPGDLSLHSLQIQGGPRGPKRMDRAHGARFDRGVKRRRMSHIILELSYGPKS